MVIAVLLMMVLSAVGIGYVLQAKTETQISANDMRWSQSMFSAEAGVAEAVSRMRDPDDLANYIGEPEGTVTPGWTVYMVDQLGSSADDPNIGLFATDGMDNNGDGDVDEEDEVPPEVMTQQVGDNAIDYPWVRVEYVTQGGQPLRFGDHDLDVTTPQQYNFVAGEPVIRVTAEGHRGSAQRQIQVEAVKPAIDLVNAAIYAEDDDFKFNGTQFLVSGVDYDPLTGDPVPGGAEVPGIATTMDPDNISGALRPNQRNNIEGEGAEPSVTTSPVDIDLEALVETYGALADRVVPASTVSNVSWGTFDDYQITLVEGDLHGSGGLSGGGILLIEGDFTCTGQMLWYGLVVVLGDITFSGGGAGIHIFGSVLVQGGIDNQTVGGNADIFYSSEALGRLSGLSRYQATSWIEL